MTLFCFIDISAQIDICHIVFAAYCLYCKLTDLISGELIKIGSIFSKVVMRNFSIKRRCARNKLDFF